MQGEMNFVIEGGKQLSGRVETSRSKNCAVALLAASLLNRGRTTLHQMPKIEEVNRLIEVLRSIDVGLIDRDAATKTRSILMFIGSLIHLFKDFELPQSGGCTLGLRSVRQHLWVLEKFGVSIETLTDRYHIRHSALTPATAILYEASDTATINALLATAKLPGTSTIKYASANYQVQEVCGFLKALGVGIKGR